MKSDYIVNGIYTTIDDHYPYYVILNIYERHKMFKIYRFKTQNSLANQEIQNVILENLKESNIRHFNIVKVGIRYLNNRVDGYVGHCSEEFVKKLRTIKV